MQQSTCIVGGCDRNLRNGGYGYCAPHYQRVLRSGDPGSVEIKPKDTKPKRPCSVSDCESVAYCKGLCTKHYQQMSNRGELDPPRVTGAGHHSWHGDDVGYRSLHERIRTARSKASEQACVDCGLPALHWSYDHTDPNELTAPQGTYSLDVHRYEPRCAPCHNAFDHS